MRTRLNLVLCIAAGFFGGFLLPFSSVPVYAQAQTAPKNNATIRISREGRIYLNDKPVNINRLADQIRGEFPTAAEVYLTPDKDTTWDPVSQVLAALRAAKPPIPVRFTDLENPK